MADDTVAVIAQIETPEALASLEEIAAVPGVDALFIGPGDLSAAMNHRGNPGHEDVQAAVFDFLCPHINVVAGLRERGVLPSHMVDQRPAASFAGGEHTHVAGASQ